MEESPGILYAKNGDVHVAYNVLGDGPPDLLAFALTSVLPIDSHDDEPSLARFLRRLASFSRLIRFDVRGVGLSDPVAPSSPPTLEQWAQDAVAVLDAVDSRQATAFACGASAPEALLLAASFPERISKMIIINGAARFTWAEDYPTGVSQKLVDGFLEQNMEPDAIQRGYDHLAQLAPSVADDTAFRHWFDRSGNRGASPATARSIMGVHLRADVRSILPAVRVPTLILHRRDDAIFGSGHGRYLADHIPGARYVELDGADDLCWVGDTDVMLDEIEEFLTGARRGPDPNRVLATVLFTDIVKSTESLAKVGDRKWGELLDRHDEVVRRQLGLFKGRQVKSTGDGVLAVFDGPARAVQCACAIRDGAAQLGVDIRSGVHTGEIEQRGDDIAGMAVHIAARMESLAQPGEVLVSRTVVDLVVGSGIEFSDRGEHGLKGVPGTWVLFAVSG